jgi:hypothetical protein
MRGGWQKIFQQAKVNYESSRFLIEQLGAERYLEPRLMATLAQLRQGLIAGIESPTAADTMMADTAVIAYRNLLRVWCRFAPGMCRVISTSPLGACHWWLAFRQAYLPAGTNKWQHFGRFSPQGRRTLKSRPGRWGRGQEREVVMRNNRLLQCACLSAALLLCAGVALAAPPDKAKGKPPLQLETYRSFFVGGQRVNKPDSTVRLDGHAYVEAFIPRRPAPFKKLPPIIVTHPSLSATIWLERANGEEGWALLFARAGYPVYVVGPPGTGRAARDRDLITALSQISQSRGG